MANDRKTRTKRTAPSLPPAQAKVAGIDVGSSQHWVCGPPQDEDDDGEPNVRMFGTTTPDLNELVDWLVAQGVTSAAME